MQTGGSRGLILVSVVGVLLVILVIAWFVIPDQSVRLPDSDSGAAQELPPPTVEEKMQLYQNLQGDQSAEPLPEDERARVYEQTQVETQTQTEAPSASDRQKLLESFGQ